MIRDRESKFTAGIDEIFRTEGVEVIRLPYRTPWRKERGLGSPERAEAMMLAYIQDGAAIPEDDRAL